jgi:hypothetical protein
MPIYSAYTYALAGSLMARASRFPNLKVIGLGLLSALIFITTITLPKKLVKVKLHWI